MYQKNQAILLWTYSRNEKLLDLGFLVKVIDSMLSFSGQLFHLDNFDLLLIVQSALHLSRSETVKKDQVFMTKLKQLTIMADTFVLKEMDKLNVHEFTTVCIYYLTHLDVCSQPLKTALIDKICRAVSEFNEY